MKRGTTYRVTPCEAAAGSGPEAPVAEKQKSPEAVSGEGGRIEGQQLEVVVAVDGPARLRLDGHTATEFREVGNGNVEDRTESYY